MASCSECTCEWTGFNMAHCSDTDCHQTFSCVRWFDAHRIEFKLRGNTHKGPMSKCADPSSLLDKNDQPLLKQNEHGTWVGAATRPEEIDG